MEADNNNLFGSDDEDDIEYNPDMEEPAEDEHKEEYNPEPVPVPAPVISSFQFPNPKQIYIILLPYTIIR